MAIALHSPNCVSRHCSALADGREHKKGNGIENEHDAQCHGYLLFIRFDNRRYRRDGAAAADGGAAGDEVRCLPVNFQQYAQQCAECQRADDGGDVNSTPCLPAATAL